MYYVSKKWFYLTRLFLYSVSLFASEIALVKLYTLLFTNKVKLLVKN